MSLDSGELITIAGLAVEYIKLREHWRKTKALRNGCLCQHEDSSGPCWKLWENKRGGIQERVPESEWCAECVKRERLHEEYRKATRPMQNAYQRLRRGVLSRIADSKVHP